MKAASLRATLLRLLPSASSIVFLSGIVACAAGCASAGPSSEEAVEPDLFPVTLSPGVAPGEAEGCDGDGLPLGRLRGEVYDVPLETRLLPDFSALQPAETICLDRLDVTPRRSVYPAVPGLKDRFRWFALDLRGVVQVDDPGLFYFRLTSDDGSQLFVDDTLVIDNDGYHPARMALGAARITSAGHHTLRVAYWQGPGPLALVLEVSRPGEPYRVLRVDQPL